MHKFAILPDRAVLRLSGADTRSLLQGLITVNIDRLNENTALFSALLTPQGKILFDFFLYTNSQDACGDILIDCPAKMAVDLKKRLLFYRLRANVKIEGPLEEYGVAVSWNGEIADHSPLAQARRDARLEAMGYRYIDMSAALERFAERGGYKVATAQQYHHHRILNGIPEGPKDYSYSAIFPHEANFDQLGGVDFDKGCYVGQEVVSRMHHKTVMRKRLVPITGAKQLPEPGSRVTGGKANIGTLGSVDGRFGIAMIRLDRAARSLEAGERLFADTVTITLHKPVWASFDVPVAGSESTPT